MSKCYLCQEKIEGDDKLMVHELSDCILALPTEMPMPAYGR